MTAYEYKIQLELKDWQQEMQKQPGLVNKMAKHLQDKINSYIPEKVHHGITVTVKQMIRAVLFGAELTNTPITTTGTLEEKEDKIKARVAFYRKTAAAEGGITGAGGILLGLADFPLLIGIKIKLMFEIAALYGINVKDYKERLYLLHIFQLAFSSQQTRNQVYQKLANWQQEVRQLPADIHQFNWRIFQQDYRDYLDLAKMAQMIPIIGAPIGAIVNYNLLDKLGKTAMNAYRMRLLNNPLLTG